MKSKFRPFIARRWETLHNLELKEKKLFLRKLSLSESQRTFDNFYQFAQKINKGAYKNRYKKHRCIGKGAFYIYES